MSAKDEKALKIASFVFLGIILFIAVSCIPQNSWLRNPETGSLIDGSLLLDAIVPLFTILFFVPGLVYGRISGKFKTAGICSTASATPCAPCRVYLCGVCGFTVYQLL